MVRMRTWLWPARLLHDLGKIWELEIGASIEYTDDGRLLGHLPMEVLFVERMITELERFPAEITPSVCCTSYWLIMGSMAMDRRGARRRRRRSWST